MKETCKVPGVKQMQLLMQTININKHPAMCSFDNPIPYSSDKIINDYCCPDDFCLTDVKNVQIEWLC